MLTSKRARLAIALICATVLIAVYPLAALAADGYRADTGSYNEEGFGYLAPYAPYTEYRADTGSYNEEGFGYLAPYAPYTETTYRAATGSYNEEGFGYLD
jgi:hypothetical protein